MAKLMQTKLPDHDDFCQKSRFWSAECTCGGDVREIVREATEGFRRDVARIMGRATQARRGSDHG